MRRKFGPRQPHLGIMGLRLPDGEGLVPLPEIRRTHPALPVLVLTAWITGTTERDTLAAGADGRPRRATARPLRPARSGSSRARR
jgi:DNA-binding NarL/FixJ family response regulator